MNRTYGHNEAGFKQTVKIRLDGRLLERGFRNKGEAFQYLQKQEDMTKEEINRRVSFLCK